MIANTTVEDVDVIVLGAGAAGLTAALAAHEAGASVAVLEKAAVVGGTTAMSGGVVWVPDSAPMREAGLEDDRGAARRYIARLAEGRGDEALIDRYLESAPQMVDFVHTHTDVRFTSLATYPDYHPEFPGGAAGGRSLDNELFDPAELGEWAGRLRRNPVNGRSPITIREAVAWKVFARPMSIPFKTVVGRARAGIVHGGAALAGRLLRACLDRDILPRLGTPARELITDARGRVVGVVAEDPDGRRLTVRARRGVILATGGFEWDEGLVRRFLRGVPTHPTSAPSCTGDGLRMAMRLGADLGNMSEAWWCPAVEVPGERYDARPMSRAEFAARCLPHSLIVNRAGRRFVNEACNYNDVVRPMFDFDPVRFERPNLPCWLIVDQRFMERYILVTAVPGRPAPDWIARADSARQLAAQLGVDPDGLEATLARFNRFADQGRDDDFQRGESAFERFYGDPDQRPNPNLGRLAEPPFYAVELKPGTIGTKGGPRVDGDGRVLHVDGHAIAGLYAAGNVMASVMGPGYPGAGSTIGVAMTWGWLAARHAASEPSS